MTMSYHIQVKISPHIPEIKYAIPLIALLNLISNISYSVMEQIYVILVGMALP